ncbi:MAG TPA: flagellar biosynthetic protein FliO [Acetobacteraceae bacterium]|nr:flagellar biosynthetic protein FliO [Acetobacteraceae bacterium]
MSTSQILTALAALAAVLALILLARQAVRLAGGGRGTVGRLLRVSETVPLDGRRRLHLIDCDGRRALLLTGGPQDLLLGWIGETPAAAPERLGGDARILK